MKNLNRRHLQVSPALQAAPQDKEDREKHLSLRKQDVLTEICAFWRSRSPKKFKFSIVKYEAIWSSKATQSLFTRLIIVSSVFGSFQKQNCFQVKQILW